MKLDALFRKVGIINFTRDFHQEHPNVFVEVTINKQPYVFGGYHDFLKWIEKSLPENVNKKILEYEFEPGIEVGFVTGEDQYIISVNTVKRKFYPKMP